MTAGSAGEDDSDDDGEEDANGIQRGEARSGTMHEEHAGPVPADAPQVIRPGIVHRIDKGTSGTVRPILHAFLQLLKSMEILSLLLRVPMLKLSNASM